MNQFVAMNRRDRLGRVEQIRRELSLGIDPLLPEAAEHLRFCLEEIGRLDEMRDQIRDLRTRVELLQYQLRSMSPQQKA